MPPSVVMLCVAVALVCGGFLLATSENQDARGRVFGILMIAAGVAAGLYAAGLAAAGDIS